MELSAQHGRVDFPMMDHDPFLQHSPYCDWHHPTIQHLMRSTTAHVHSERDAARALFTWVRDHILFRVGQWNATASKTLAAREGTCTNKANLVVALARAYRIPAAYYVQQVRGQDYLGPIVPPRLRRWIAPRSTHVHPALYLGGRWVRCDPTDDRTFAQNTVHLNPQSALVTWDGEHDALIRLDPTHILAEAGPLGEIEGLLAKTARIPTLIVRLGNVYVRFLRDHAHRYQTQDALELAFQVWLRQQAPGLFLLYVGLGLWRGR
jgi:hypothetical protein